MHQNMCGVSSLDAVQQLNEMMGGSGVFRGIYRDDSAQNELTIYSIFSGLCLPKDRVAQLIQAFGEEALAAVKLPKVLGRALVGLGFTDAVRDEAEAEQWKKEQAERQAALAAAGAVVDNVTKG